PEVSGIHYGHKKRASVALFAFLQGSSAGCSKFAGGEFAGVFAHQLFGTLAAATTISAYAQFLTDLRTAITGGHRLLDLLLGNGFAQTDVHSMKPDANYFDLHCSLNAKDLQ